MAQEVVLDLDFAGIENLRKLYSNIDEEKEYMTYLESERAERILKLSKLSKRNQKFNNWCRYEDGREHRANDWVFCYTDSFNLQPALTV